MLIQLPPPSNRRFFRDPFLLVSVGALMVAVRGRGRAADPAATKGDPRSTPPAVYSRAPCPP